MNGTLDVTPYVPSSLNVDSFGVDGKIRIHFVELTIPASELPLRFKVRSRQFTSHSEPEKDQFYFEEHSCPTNWLRDIVEVYDKNGDSDPHGFMKYVGPWVDSGIKEKS